MGGITEYDFPHGLTVLLYPDPANPKVTVDVTYTVGSRHEGYGETGMAHLLEHMNFIETTNGRKIKDEIVSHGAQWNGATSYDRTNFFETVTASDENLKWALGLEADRMVNVKFTKQILDTEMTVVRNEFERGENAPTQVLNQRVMATAYLWHNYGKAVIGSKEDIEKVPVNRLAEFYRKFYQPDNAVVIVTGRFDDSKALQFVAETLGRIPRATRVLDETYTVEPAQDGERYIELRRVGQNPAVEMAYHGPSAGHPDSAAFQVLAGIMDGLEGRLTKAIVDSKLATSASMFAQRMHDPGVIEFVAVLTPDQSLDEVKKAMLKVIDGIVTEPPSKEEMDRVKTNLLRSLESSLANPQAIATGALTAAVSQGDWRLMFADHDRLQKVTAEDVARVAKAYLKPSNRTVGYYIPDAAPDRTVVPASPSLKVELKDYKSAFTIAHGEAFDPTPANVESRAVRAKLPNGMKTVILPKQTEANKVAAIISLHFGDEATLKDKSAVGNVAGALFSYGTRTKNRQQLAEEMRKLDANIMVFGGYNGASANIIVPASNLTAALKLAVEMLREPGYPEADFQRVWQQRVKQLEIPPTEPVQLAAETLNRHLTPYAPGDAFYPNKREEQLVLLKAVTLDEVKRFHDQYYGANYGEFAAVGPVDPAAVRKDLAEILGNWNTAMAYKPPAPSPKKVAPIDIKIETPDKANAQFVAGLTFAMSDGDPDQAAMMLASYMFGGSITSRVSDRIRNREGLSYGANAGIGIPARGSSASLNASISLNPVNGPKVEASFVDELQKTVKDGFTGQEVNAAKKAYLEQRAVGRASDTALASLLVNHEDLGRTMKWDDDLEKKIAAMTADQVNAAFRRHIDPAALSIVKAGDFKAAKVYQ